MVAVFDDPANAPVRSDLEGIVSAIDLSLTPDQARAAPPRQPLAPAPAIAEGAAGRGAPSVCSRGKP